MKMYHIDRDYTMTLVQQKRAIKKQYTNVQYISSDGRKVHIMAD